MVEERGGRILVVEDDRGTARLQSAFLQRRGHTVTVAHTVDDARRQVVEARPELIVLDYQLDSGISGLDFCRMLQAEGYGVPVIMVTGFGQEATVIEALRMGIRDFVLKEDDYLDYLAESVERALRQARTEQQLATSEALLGSVVGCAMDGILVLDAGQKITLFNAAAERMFACSSQDALSQSVDRFLLEIDESTIPSDQDVAAATSCGTMRLEMRGRRADGTEFPVEVSFWPAELAGEAICTVVVRDITERKHAEKMLRRKEEMLRHSQKLEAVGSLAAGIAHEFNNLLQAIHGYAQFAMEGLPEASMRRQDIEQVILAADRATALTRQLLTFGRGQILERTLVAPQRVIDDLLKMLRPLIGEHIDLSVVQDADLYTLDADPNQLQQLLLNLCINARDAMPDGGTLVIKAENTIVSPEFCALNPDARPGPHVLITVADNGVGMSREVLEHIFEPFFTTKPSGTGFGLPTVYGIVQQHHGAIYVFSEPGRGSTFKIYLPATDKVAAETDEPARPVATGGGETILVAEDEPVVRRLFVRVLESAGYRVHTAVDGEDALRVFLQHADEIALVILDQVMPKMKGAAVADRLRTMQPQLAILFCSGYAPEPDEQNAMSEQGPHIQKPFDPQVLLAMVRELIDRRGAPATNSQPAESSLQVVEQTC